MPSLIHQVPTPCPVRHWGPQIDTAMEASLGAPGRWPRTELDDEDYPQGGWAKSISVGFAVSEAFASILQVVGDNVCQPGSSERSPVRESTWHFC